MTKISKNCYKGDPIKSPQEITDLAEQRKSIYHHFWGIKPARCIEMMQLNTLVNAIKRGSLFRVINIKEIDS